MELELESERVTVNGWNCYLTETTFRVFWHNY